MNYKADTEYDLMYIDDKFNEHNYTLKPDEDMNTPQVILELQANCDDFFKLVEDDEKLQEDYINLDDVQSLQAKDKNVIAYEMDLYLDTDGDRYRLLKSYANMLDRKPSILWVGFSNEEVADLTPNLGEIDDNAKKFGYKYNMQVATDNLDYDEITHKLNNITNDVAIGGNWLYVDDIHRIDKDDIRNKAVQNMLYENKKLNGGDVMMNINYDNLNNDIEALQDETMKMKSSDKFKSGYKDGINHIKAYIEDYAKMGKDVANSLVEYIENKYSEVETDVEGLGAEYIKGVNEAFEDIIEFIKARKQYNESKQLKTESKNTAEVVLDILRDMSNKELGDVLAELADDIENHWVNDENFEEEKEIYTEVAQSLRHAVIKLNDIKSISTESKQIKTEAVENNVRLGFKDIVEDVLQGAITDGTITEVTDELITKCVDALEDEDELYDLIIGIIYDTIENKKVKTEAKESVKEYTCIEDRQGGDWAVGDTMTAEEWGERAAGWAYADNWEDSDEPLLKNFKTEQDCIDFICDIWEITIVPSTDPRAQEFINNNMQKFENKEVKTEEVLDDINEVEKEYKEAYGKDLDFKTVPCVIAKDTYLSGWGYGNPEKLYQVILCGSSVEAANIEYTMKNKAKDEGLSNIRRAFGISSRVKGSVSYKIGRYVKVWNDLSDSWYETNFNTENN